MSAHDKRTMSSDRPKPAGQEEKAHNEDGCRCKEVSKMPPGQLLKLMISDLAFWRKEKKD